MDRHHLHSLPGTPSERNLSFTESEVDLIRKEVEESRTITARINSTQNIAYGKGVSSYSVRGVMPGYYSIEKLTIGNGEGRFINRPRHRERNKVIVLDKKIADLLFKDESPLGKQVKVGQLMFKVVGVNNKKEQWGSSNTIAALQTVFNPNRKFYQITFTVEGHRTEAENDRFNESSGS